MMKGRISTFDEWVFLRDYNYCVKLDEEETIEVLVIIIFRVTSRGTKVYATQKYAYVFLIGDLCLQ